MKNIFRLLMFVGAVSMVACDDPDGLDNWFDKPEADRDITVTLPASELVLTKAEEWDTITFSWNPINKPTDEYTINYVLKLGVVGDNFATSYSSGDLGGDATSFTMTKRALNKFLVETHNLRYGQIQQVQVKVLAYIDGGSFYYKPSIDIEQFDVTPYEIPIQHFYIVGAANPKSDMAGDGIEVSTIISNSMYQTTSTVLNPNSTFVLSTQRDSKYPAFVDGGDGKMVYVANETDAAKYSEFSTLGEYVDGALGKANNYAVSIEYDAETQIPTGHCYIGRYPTVEVFIVGDAGPGWGNFTAFKYDYKNYPDMLIYPSKFSSAGEGMFKLHDSKGYTNSGHSWRPAVGGADPRSDHRVVTNFGGDPKWKIPAGADGNYTLQLKNHELWIDLIPQ